METVNLTIEGTPVTVGSLPLLVVQGALRSPLVEAADLVIPGASFTEKEASYTNERGRVQSRAGPVPAPTWLETSNPSERWKWDVLFQDLPPVKGATPVPAAPPGPAPPGEQSE